MRYSRTLKPRSSVAANARPRQISRHTVRSSIHLTALHSPNFTQIEAKLWCDVILSSRRTQIDKVTQSTRDAESFRVFFFMFLAHLFYFELLGQSSKRQIYSFQSEDYVIGVRMKTTKKPLGSSIVREIDDGEMNELNHVYLGILWEFRFASSFFVENAQL